MAQAKKCDRCGKFYDIFQQKRKFRIEADCVQYGRTLDLCESCYAELEKWVGDATPEIQKRTLVVSRGDEN